MKRRNRAVLHRRAHNAATGWETPTEKLSANDAVSRLRLMWLKGYEARQRDARKDLLEDLGLSK